MDDERLELLGKIASWYYEDNKDQSWIAKQIGRSRSMVSRMLQEARQYGVVEINVKYPLKTDFLLEANLSKAFNLKKAIVFTSTYPLEGQALLRRMGVLTARYLQQYLQGEVKIGLGWGTAVYETVQAINPTPLEKASVVQVVGAVGHSLPIANGPELVRQLAEKLTATYRLLPAPLIVSDAQTAQALRQDRSIKEALAWADKADVTIVGIGTLEAAYSTLHQTGYLHADDLQQLQQSGAVGDVLGCHLDIAGQLVDVPLNQCIIGQDMESLRRVPLVVAIAGGLPKAHPILAVLRSGCLDVLVTDASTAQAVLQLHQSQEET